MPFLGWPEMALVVLILLVVFGPERMPQMARALGEAIREYRKVAEAPLSEAPPLPKPTEDQVLIDTAKKLGITTEGKTTEQIAAEILKKASEVRKELPPQPAPSTEATEEGKPTEKKESEAPPPTPFGEGYND